MKLYEEKEVTQIVKVQSKIICDGCKKEINPMHGYFSVRTQHYDWGNDSIDSVEHYDYCCPTCVLEFASPYINESYEGRFNTMEIEIEHVKGYNF